jgi:hypothetical protein
VEEEEAEVEEQEVAEEVQQQQESLPPEEEVPDEMQVSSDDDSFWAVDLSKEATLAMKLVRYALSCEYSRTPIRREGIKEAGRSGIFKLALMRRLTCYGLVVLGKHSRLFKKVFDIAQEHLTSRFGMKMVNLPSRGVIGIPLSLNQNLTQRRRRGERSLSPGSLGWTINKG